MAEGTMDLVGSGSGSGYGDGSGSGSGSGYGSGYGYGYGYGSQAERKGYLQVAGKLLQAKRILNLDNAELKREFVEAMGADRFFCQLRAQVVHQEIDARGNPRRLCRIQMADTQAGYIQAVHVICPTTKREYYLGVPPTVETCQEAVASTFKKSAKEYNPERES